MGDKSDCEVAVENKIASHCVIYWIEVIYTSVCVENSARFKPLWAIVGFKSFLTHPLRSVTAIVITA